MITIPAGPPQAVHISANPPAITTNGSDNTTVVVAVVDAYGNPTGAGTPVSFAVDQCAGVCDLSPLSGTADTQGKVATTLRSTNISPTQTLASQIKITAQIQAGSVTASESTVVAGSFVPFRRYMSLTNRDYPLNNSTSCSALVIVPPGSAVQAPDRAFNIYRFGALAASHTVVLQGTPQRVSCCCIAWSAIGARRMARSRLRSSPATRLHRLRNISARSRVLRLGRNISLR